MMRASWHSRHAVVAFACIGPAGRSALDFAGTDFCEAAPKGEASTRASKAKATITVTSFDRQHAIDFFSPTDGLADWLDDTGLDDMGLGDMDLHLIDSVVKITTGIPKCCGKLGATLAVGSARLYGVVAALGFPFIVPQAPGIVSVVVAELCRIPTRAAVG